MNNFYENILEYTKDIDVIDTHEHLPNSEDARDKDTDVLKEYLCQYFRRDLISAGLKMDDYVKVINNHLPIMDRWKIVEPYWEFCRNTGYGRSLDIAVKGLYGIEKICGETIEELNSLFLTTLKPGHFKKVLKEKCRIKTSLLVRDVLVCDKNFFSIVPSIGSLVSPATESDVKKIETESGVKIHSFDDWLDATKIMIDKHLKMGAVGLKCGLAYTRSLNFERVTKSDAENDFNKIFNVKHYPDWQSKTFVVGKKFQDYMMHFILRIAAKNNVTMQIHTGIQEGNGNIIYNSDPSLLTNLFLEYPDVDFDIFHIGYPYQHVLSALAKMFPNVFIDMCWAHIISPEASINSLIEWIDSVPINKISAFGGDYRFVDGVYGHLQLAKMNVSRALAKKVEDGVFDLDRAKKIVDMLFYENPNRIFKLKLS